MTRLVLHGGAHKTATSPIQSVLNRNAEDLAARDIAYVHHRKLRRDVTVPAQVNAYDMLGVAPGLRPTLASGKRQVSDDELAAFSAAFFAPILAAAPERVVLSEENLLGHCGHCVRRGQLYGHRRRMAQKFAQAMPLRVDEVYLAIRGYPEFFAAAYVEFLRSASPGRFVPEAEFKANVMARMPSWHSVLQTLRTAFPHAAIRVWRYEDFPALEPRILAALCGPGVEAAQLTYPAGRKERPTASGRAIAELLRAVARDGVKPAFARRVELQEQYPRADYGRYDPWSAQERDILADAYADHVAQIRADPDFDLIEP